MTTTNGSNTSASNQGSKPDSSQVGAAQKIDLEGIEVRKPAPPGITADELTRHASLARLLKTKFGVNLKELFLDLGDVVAVVAREQFLDVVRILKLDSQLQFNQLMNVTAVDWLDTRETRFDVVYHFVSVGYGFRLRLKVPLGEQDAVIPSLVPLYAGAEFMERETWDMLGISFRGHPDQRRILMYDEFVGHPLRKDYPVQAKQPRIPLRAPEVENTARHMQRPSLYSINSKKNAHTGTPAATTQGAAPQR